MYNLKKEDLIPQTHIAITQSDEDLNKKDPVVSDGETLPLLRTHNLNVRNIPFTKRPLIKKLEAIYQTEKLIFLSIALGNAIVTIGEGFQSELMAIIGWAKWITILNAAIAASLGIYKMNNPDADYFLRKPFIAILLAESAATFSLQAILAFILLDYLNQNVVNISDLVFIAICLTPLIIGVASALTYITDYKPKPLNSTNHIAKFISYLGLQVANTGSTLQTTVHYLFDLLNYSAVNYKQLCYRFLAAGVAAFAIESTRIADTFKETHRFYKYIKHLTVSSIPRKILSEALDLTSMFNYAVFWTSFYMQTCPTKKYPTVDVATFDIQAFLLLLIVMSPVLAALVGDSICSFIKSIPKLLEDCQNNYLESSDESDEELQFPNDISPRDDTVLMVNDSDEERLQHKKETQLPSMSARKTSDVVENRLDNQSKDQAIRNKLDVVVLSNNTSKESSPFVSSLDKGYHSDNSLDLKYCPKMTKPVTTENRHAFFTSSTLKQKAHDDENELPETLCEKEEEKLEQQKIFSTFMTRKNQNSQLQVDRNTLVTLPSHSTRRTSYSRNYASE